MGNEPLTNFLKYYIFIQILSSAFMKMQFHGMRNFGHYQGIHNEQIHFLFKWSP